MQKLNCSLLYSLLKYGCKCTTFFILTNKMTKKYDCGERKIMRIFH